MISRRGFFKGLLGLGAGLFASRCVQPMPEFALGDSVVAHTPSLTEKSGSTPITPAIPCDPGQNDKVIVAIRRTFPISAHLLVEGKIPSIEDVRAVKLIDQRTEIWDGVRWYHSWEEWERRV